MIITYILVSSIIATGAFAVGVAQRRERRRLGTMVQEAHIPHRLEQPVIEQPVSQIAELRMELELRTLQLEAERLETDRLRSIIRSTMR